MRSPAPSCMSANLFSYPNTGWRKHAALLIAVVVPCVFIVWRIWLNMRNIPYWDEFDSVLALLLRAKYLWQEGGLIGALLEVHNEHRMATSRVMFLLSYVMTGAVDFLVLGWIGNGFFFSMLWVLVRRAAEPGQRVILASFLALGVVHLAHHENLFWSGSSIDHFQVPLLAALAFAGLASRTWLGFAGAALAALAATFTLAHGILIWGVGIVWLIAERRRLGAAIWVGLAGLAVYWFLDGLALNPQHQHAVARDVGLVILHWLCNLGAATGVQHVGVAVVLGAGMVTWLLLLGFRRAWRASPVAAAMVLFCVSSLLLIAIGRVGVTGYQLVPTSRYMVLSCVALSLSAWLEFRVQSAGQPIGGRASRALMILGLALLAVNVVSNFSNHGLGQKFADRRERALAYFGHFGQLRDAVDRLYPVPERSTELLKEAIKREIYRPPQVGRKVMFASKQEIGGVKYFFEDLRINERGIYAVGWSYILGQEAERGRTFLVLRSDVDFEVFRTASSSRADVVKALDDPLALNSGFRTFVPMAELRPGVYQVGLLFQKGSVGVYTMTDHRLEVVAGEFKAGRGGRAGK